MSIAIDTSTLVSQCKFMYGGPSDEEVSRLTSNDKSTQVRQVG